MCKSETLSAYLICAYVCSICFNIAWVDWDSGPHFFTKMNQFVWCETQADFVAALCEIFHKRCAQPKMDFSQFTSLESRNGWQKEEFHIRVWIDDFEIPNCQHAQCFASGSLQKVGEPWSLYSFLPSKIPPGRTRMRCWCFDKFPQECHRWKLMTCWCKTTRRYVCKRVLPKCIEFILKLVICQQNKNKHWMMWLSAQMYRVWGGYCRTVDAKNIRPNSICYIPQWPYLPDSFGHLRVGCVWRLGPALHPPKRCANALNFASRLLLNGWVHAGLASRTLLEKAWQILSPKTTHDSAQSWTRSVCWKGNIDFHGFPLPLQVDNQSWNKKCAGLEHQSDFVETRDIYNYMFC